LHGAFSTTNFGPYSGSPPLPASRNAVLLWLHE
jgi:hypothetical protein